MAWKIEFDSAVEKDLRKLDLQTQKRILNYLRTRIMPSADPRALGKALHGNLAGFWRYRVGDHRIICKIIDQTVTVVVLAIGHRKEVYE